MSTLAALVLVSSSAVVIDVCKFHLRSTITQKVQMRLMRFFTVLFLVLSFILAIIAEQKFQFIVDLMSLSWGTVAGSFMAPYVYGLFWKGTTRLGALAGMFSGLLTAIILFNVVDKALFPISASVAMILPFAVVPVVSLLTPKLQPEILEKAFDEQLPERNKDNSDQA